MFNISSELGSSLHSRNVDVNACIMYYSYTNGCTSLARNHVQYVLNVFMRWCNVTLLRYPWGVQLYFNILRGKGEIFGDADVIEWDRFITFHLMAGL